MKTITKKEHGALCFPESERIQKFIDSKTFDVVALGDGFATVEKSTIKKDFCFGCGMYGTATDEEIADAESMVVASKKWDYFYTENVREIKERIKILENAIKTDESGMFKVRGDRVAVIGIFNKYFNEKLIKDWQELDSTYCRDIITPSEIIKGASFCNRINYRLATRAELSALLDAEKRQLANFEKRLANWWKRYGTEKINALSYIVD